MRFRCPPPCDFGANDPADVLGHERETGHTVLFSWAVEAVEKASAGADNQEGDRA